ncbi:MAG: DNA cytosine methyltransferase [Synergistaceae bacterium]|nr:DNA cytosine methyltransferase [Synergistaceae bacterium]
MRTWQGLSLFSGIGGLDLAFEWAGGIVSAMCEIEPYCRNVLRKHWPDVPLFNDIRRLNGSDVGAVDIIYGGFPCQPFSVAGVQRGKDDSRYLWPEFSRMVAEIKPRWIVAENVSGILRIAADDVCSDLERQGYSVGIWDFEAAAVGAKHRRERVFFVAHSNSSRFKISNERREITATLSERAVSRLERSGCLPNADSFWGGGWWESEPGVDRVAYGLPHRVDRLRALGNAVVPQQAYPIFKAIIDADESEV